MKSYVSNCLNCIHFNLNYNTLKFYYLINYTIFIIYLVFVDVIFKIDQIIINYKNDYLINLFFDFKF